MEIFKTVWNLPWRPLAVFGKLVDRFVDRWL